MSSSDAVSASLLRDVAGSPRLIQQSGHLVRRGGMDLATLAERAAAGGARAVVRESVARLSTDERRVLQTLALIGDTPIRQSRKHRRRRVVPTTALQPRHSGRSSFLSSDEPTVPASPPSRSSAPPGFHRRRAWFGRAGHGLLSAVRGRAPILSPRSGAFADGVRRAAKELAPAQPW
jgi:hypothetical protein